MGFNMNSLVNDAARQREAAPRQNDFTIHYINIKDIMPSDQNFYGIRDIEPLAADIEENGLLHNLVVRQADDAGKFRIISGERRYRACLLLYEGGDMRFASLPSIIKTTQSDLLAELQLISANANARDLTDYERTQQITRTKQLLLQLKESGYKFSGRMRDMLADMFDVSPAQIGRAEKISTDLAPELAEGFRDGKIGVTAAYELATMPEEEQAAAARELKATGTITTGKKRESRREAVRAQYADMDCRYGGLCTNADNLASFYDSKTGGIEGCGGCCASCNKRATCEKCCGAARASEEPSLDDELERIISEGQHNNPYAQKVMSSYGFLNDKDRREFLDTYERWGLWFEEPRLHVRYYRCELPNGLQIIVEKQDNTIVNHKYGAYEQTHIRYHVAKGPGYNSPEVKSGDYAGEPPAQYAIEGAGITEILVYMGKPKGTTRILNASDLAVRDKK